MKTMTPETEAELAEVIRSANGSLAVCGGATTAISTDGEAVSTASLSGITLHEPGALTLVARAGTPVAEIERAGTRRAASGVRADGLPASVGTRGEPTIGGVMAGNRSGPRRIQAGAARDFALGVRFVDGTGQVIVNGGRVMKNVTGYDLVKLMCGSWGTLGVLTEVSLKVLPQPETEATLVFREADAAEAVAVMSAALGSPFEVTGAAWVGAEAQRCCGWRGSRKGATTAPGR